MNPKIIISIVDFNGEENTKSCLKSIEQLVRNDFILEIVIVDNESKIPLSLPKDFITLPFTIIRNKNSGYSGGHNVGIQYALKNGADYVMPLNNDTRLDKFLLQELFKVISHDESIGIVSPKIYYEKGHEYHVDSYKKDELGKVFWYAGGQTDWKNVFGNHRGVDKVDQGQFDTIEEIEFATGCCLLIRKEVFKKAGMFDESYFLYFEDNDLSQRVKKAGFKILYVPKAVLWHINAGSTGGSGSKLQDYYLTRNRMLLGMKYAPLKTKLFLIKESVALLFSGREWQKIGIRDFYLNKFGKGSYK